MPTGNDASEKVLLRSPDGRWAAGDGAMLSWMKGISSASLYKPDDASTILARVTTAEAVSIDDALSIVESDIGDYRSKIYRLERLRSRLFVAGGVMAE